MNLKEMLLSGKTLPDIDIYDAHAHIGTCKGTSSIDSSGDGIYKSMKNIGIKKTAVSSISAFTTELYSSNDDVVSTVKKYPGEMLGYVSVNPHYKNGTVDEIKRCLCDGIVGIKIHASHISVPINDERMTPCYEYANENGCIVLVHTYYLAEVCELEKTVIKYPGAKFIFAHSGTESGYKRTAEIIKKYPNAYCDICMSMPRANMLEWLVKYGDDNKILYGTDAPLTDQRVMIGRILLSDISDESKVKILGDNFMNLFYGG